MICALYARVSTDKQDELNQMPKLRQAAFNRGYRVFAEYRDIASGRSSDRPGWLNLLEDAKAGKFSTIIVVKLDRVMRSLQHLMDVLETLDSLAITLECLDIGVIDTRTPMGKFQVQLFGAVAEWEAGVISERTVAALEARKARGIKLGRPVTNQFDLMTAAKLRYQGYTYEQVAKKLGCKKYDLVNHRAELKEMVLQMGKMFDEE